MRDITSLELVKEMKIGWNLGDTLDATGKKGLTCETSWGNPQTSKSMLDMVKDAGFNTTRIPVTWDKHMSDAPDYTIDAAWMKRVQEIVDFSISNDMFTIMDLHHESWHTPTYDNFDNAKHRLSKVWGQIAERFADYDERLIFDGMNEPRMVGTPFEWNGGNSEGWDVLNKLNEVFIETIRNGRGNNKLRHLLIPTYAASTETIALKGFIMPENADDKVMVSVHAYTPYEFALQAGKKSEWSKLNPKDTHPIDDLMKNLNEIFVSKGFPVILGEFGARDKENIESRVQWAIYYVSKAKQMGIPCIWWDNGCFEGKGERFGLLDRHKLDWRYPQIIEALMEGLR